MSVQSAEQKSVWLFITALCVGGAAKTLVDLANNLNSDEYEVTVWTIFATTPLETELRGEIRIRSLTSYGEVTNDSVTGVTNPIAYIQAPIKFWYTIILERPDLLQSFLFFDNIIARVGGFVSRTPVITGVRAVPKDPSTFRTLIDRLTIGLSDHIVSNSKAGKQLAIDRGAEPECVSVIRNGRAIATYQQRDASKIKSELDLEETELLVGTVGRLLERKGHFELITAWNNVRQMGINARLIFVGDGKDRADIERHARELGCDDSIDFLGTRRDIPELLTAMDLFAFPSHFEGLPGAVIEAMAAGLPIVATPVDGTGELIDNYQTGLFVSVDEVEELTWALIRLLESPNLRDSLGDAAQQQASEEYGIDTMVNQFESLYQEITPA